MASQSLAELNSSTLGVKMPEIILPDGTVMQTGTVGALLVNIEHYNAASAADDGADKERLATAIRASVPLLKKVGMFELFSPEEWTQGSNEGRKLVGEEYRKSFPA